MGFLGLGAVNLLMLALGRLIKKYYPISNVTSLRSQHLMLSSASFPVLPWLDNQLQEWRVENIQQVAIARDIL
jgi:hypothetical protein